MQGSHYKIFHLRLLVLHSYCINFSSITVVRKDQHYGIRPMQSLTAYAFSVEREDVLSGSNLAEGFVKDGVGRVPFLSNRVERRLAVSECSAEL